MASFILIDIVISLLRPLVVLSLAIAWKLTHEVIPFIFLEHEHIFDKLHHKNPARQKLFSIGCRLFDDKIPWESLFSAACGFSQNRLGQILSLFFVFLKDGKCLYKKESM